MNATGIRCRARVELQKPPVDGREGDGAVIP